LRSLAVDRRRPHAVVIRTFVPALCCVLALLATACSRGPEARLAEIRELQEEKRFADSLNPLRQLVEDEPGLLEAHFLLGKALMQTGELSLAIWPLRRAVVDPEYTVDAGLMMAHAMVNGRSPDDAINAIEQVLAVEPDNVEALTLRARANMTTPNKEDVLRDIDRVLALDPDNVQALIPRALALIQLSRVEEAREALKLASEKMGSTDKAVSDSMRGRLCIANGMFALEDGDQEAAEVIYADCIEAYPTNDLVVPEAVSFYDKIEKPERATEVLEHAFEESRSAYFRSALAQRMKQLGNEEEEERLIREGAEEQPSANTWFTLADYYVKRDRYDEACDAFEKAMAADERAAPMILFAYADTLIAAERYEEAEKATADVELEHLRALLRGRAKLAQGDAAGALASFEEGMRLWPNNPVARFFAGQAAEQLGDFDRAILEYRESVRASPGQSDAGLQLARLLEARGNDRAATNAIRRHIQAHSADVDGYLLAIRLARRNHQYQVLNKLIEEFSRIPGQGSRAMAEQIAMSAVGMGPRKAVNAALRTRLDLTSPENADTLREVLKQLAALGDHAAARSLFESAVERHPESAILHDLAARALLAAGKPAEQARRSYEVALQHDPEYESALIGLAKLAVAEGSTEEAIALFDRAAEANEDETFAANQAITLILASGKDQEAERRLLDLLERHPRDAQAAHALARIFAGKGNLEEALHYARRADFFVTVPEASETLGWIHLLRGESEPAVAALRRAVERRPKSTQARYRLGQALAAQGEREKALESFQELIDGDAPEAEEARAEIARLKADA